jgi:hypothetical protein
MQAVCLWRLVRIRIEGPPSSFNAAVSPSRLGRLLFAVPARFWASGCSFPLRLCSLPTAHCPLPWPGLPSLAYPRPNGANGAKTTGRRPGQDCDGATQRLSDLTNRPDNTAWPTIRPASSPAPVCSALLCSFIFTSVRCSSCFILILSASWSIRIAKGLPPQPFVCTSSTTGLD